jgi:formate hydrogenlyase subunit 4
LRLNPFSTSSAEQEIYSGPLTEYAGAALGLWKLAHGLEWVALTGLVATLVLPARRTVVLARASLRGGLLSPGACCSRPSAAGTARFTLERSIRFYWQWAAILALLAVSRPFI